MDSPYSNLDQRAYWRSAVGKREPLDPGDLYHPKFPVTRDMRVVTAGSCFAQHVGRSLRTAGYNVIDTEPFPEFENDATAQKFGYRLYSARYGNIYTARQLMQLVDEMRGAFQPAVPVWEKNDRFFDALRPSVEPDGLETAESVMTHRALHLSKVRQAFFRCDLMVFTFGLTEAWVHRESGTVYPTAPGTIAGQFDPDIYAFRNFDYQEIISDFEQFIQVMRKKNPDIKFLITTSPVPLTATASGNHVEVATCYSKSVLRAVCGSLCDRHDDVDYFPSYEIITSTNNRGIYFEANKRSVSSLGVKTAMEKFMAAHRPESPGLRANEKASGRNMPSGDILSNHDEVCEDALLDAFST
jgi:GSCFA family